MTLNALTNLVLWMPGAIGPFQAHHSTRHTLFLIPVAARTFPLSWNIFRLPPPFLFRSSSARFTLTLPTVRYPVSGPLLARFNIPWKQSADCLHQPSQEGKMLLASPTAKRGTGLVLCLTRQRKQMILPQVSLEISAKQCYPPTRLGEANFQNCKTLLLDPLNRGEHAY